MTSSPTAQRPALGFAAICLGYFMIILDTNILNVALPDLRDSLHASIAGLQWTVNGYTLVLAALLLTAGALGDRIGLKRLLLAGLATFTVASALCAAAPSTAVLVSGRVLQGLGAAALLPATLALIPHLFPEAARRQRAALAWVATSTLAIAVGPLAGGLLVDAFGWRSVFLVNVPIGVVTVALIAISVAETVPQKATRPDKLGQFLAIAALGLVTAGITSAGSAGWGSLITLLPLALGIVAAVGFVISQHRVDEPLLPPSFFAHRQRTAAVLSATLMGFAFYSVLFMLSLYFQQARGWSAGATGVGLLPATAGTVASTFLFYKPLARRFGHPVMLLVGMIGSAVGGVMFALTDHDSNYLVPATGMVLLGVFSTFVLSSLTTIIISSTPAHHSGLASGVQNTARQAGALFGIAVIGTILNGPGFIGRMHIAAYVTVADLLIGVALAGLALRSQSNQQAAEQPAVPASVRS
ncbi:MFS transporter [Streptomyces violaceorubidus]|uniref:MFS transporter n=1 Tax=Streptomyces violaceorubidus TaxID=284042 RepID=UPI00068EE2F8|nr:MFS transporter [Streptomyces violaceorubidus]